MIKASSSAPPWHRRPPSSISPAARRSSSTPNISNRLCSSSLSRCSSDLDVFAEEEPPLGRISAAALSASGRTEEGDGV